LHAASQDLGCRQVRALQDKLAPLMLRRQEIPPAELTQHVNSP
jgi:hypothetical protein